MKHLIIGFPVGWYVSSCGDFNDYSPKQQISSAEHAASRYCQVYESCEEADLADLVRGGFQPRLPTSLPPPGQQQQPSPLPRRQPVPLMPPAQLHPGAPQVVAPAPAVPLQSPPPSELMDVDPSAGPPSQAVAVQPVLQPLSLGTPKESDTAAPCPAPTQQPSTQHLVRGGLQPRLPTSLPPPGQQQQPSPLPRRQPVPLMPPAQLHPGAPQVVAPAPAVPLPSTPPSELMDVDPSAGPPSQAVAVRPVLQPLSLGTPKESDTAAPCPAPTQQPSTQRQETLPLFVGPDAPSRPVPEAAPVVTGTVTCEANTSHTA
ncbi:vegetative cell wall protein gp1-like [Schistocerca americana]|uniref:vegetative cell wall protein gp1-like n=1 Tax=Schistocerca americana TaxID=7009 RepID=UPI001F4FC2D0|nr:vegetative cell wall protein gp1-like [Schistocerca americana]